MMKILSALTLLLLVSGCVNVHVHFPTAPDAQSSAAASAKPAAADAGGNEKK